MRTIILALSIAFAACVTPTPTPDPPPPGLDPYVSACATLAAIGCQEGLKANCASKMREAQEARMTEMHVSCLDAATTKAQARACGSVRCQ